MFSRKILDKLSYWKNKPDRKPLIIRGARQVGKTTVVNLFSKEFEQYIYLNLDLSEDKNIFEESTNFNSTVDAIFFLKNSNKNEKDTLIFIDEIQNSPKAINYLRYFYENKPELFVIAAGSLLETIIDDNINFPVGRVEYLALRPFSFQEFLAASENQNIFDTWNEVPIPDYSHDRLKSLFSTYSLIGGMPEVIKSYLTDRDLIRTKEIINNLIIAYKDDVEKYSRTHSSTNILRHIINNIFFYGGERIKFQGFGNSNYKSREIGEGFRTLEKTMLVKLSYPATNYSLPIIPDKKKSPKLQILDTGLINFSIGIEKDIFISKELTDVYRGKIAEHLIGQELLALDDSPSAELNFWVREKRQSNAEVDFLFQHSNKLYPVEVKAGASGKLRSLQQFINLADQKIALRLYSGKFLITNEETIEGKKYILINLPFYLLGKIKEYIDWTENKHF